jgi:undecaprenyl phosphate-alpha-L-ara4FN deformylase
MQLALKIDVDTERGTRLGVPALLKILHDFAIPATFLFSLGPDNTGRAIKRIFRPGFLKKVSRTSVLQIYGWRTLLNGILWPGPYISRRHGSIMRRVQSEGHEVGIHCYDHIRWQDGLASMTLSQVEQELNKAKEAFYSVFGWDATTAGAAGWQANYNSLEAYDKTVFTYASDCRGKTPFFPKVGDRIFNTLQIPTTLPTLDELLGRPEYPLPGLANHYVSLLHQDKLNVLTIHAELEGMLYQDWFKSVLKEFTVAGVEFVLLKTMADGFLKNRGDIAVCDLVQGTVEGRSGTLAVQSL